MLPRTESLLQQLDDQHEVLRRAVEGVPRERREVRPRPDRWSVAEILEHIAIVEARLEKLFASKVAEARVSGAALDGFAQPDLHPWDGRRVLDRSRRVTASETVHPTGKLDADAAWAAAQRAHESFRRAVEASDGVALGQMVHPHPFFGPMNLYSWVEFVAGHEARHAAQISECASD